MTEKLDCVIVGAGVVGLATARTLAKYGRDVTVLEAESQIGSHSSSRNSEVIHAGIYYPDNSLKAQLCVRGRAMLYEYCAIHNIDHQRIGKLIVAPSESDMQKLIGIKEQAARNGVNDLIYLARDEVRKMEPAVQCFGALMSPSTGILDSHAYMISLQGGIEGHGGVIVLNSRVSGVKITDDGIRFDIDGENFVCETLINSGGLEALSLASAIEFMDPEYRPPKQYFAKAHYFAYQGESPFNHLIYPLPSGGGLGIHATNDLARSARFGPDVTWVDKVDYSFDKSRKADFVSAIREYFPDLEVDRLVAAYTGVRSKLHGPEQVSADFMIHGPSDHGVPGLVNLFGIESPGLTASLAIGELVTKLVQDQ